MNEPTTQDQTRRTILVLWAVAATLAALIATGCAVYFWSQLQQAPVSQAPAASSPFIDLQESGIPGTYKWTSKGSESQILLNADHTFIKDGNPNPAHRWALTRDGLVIFWLRSQTRFNTMERPGVYVEKMDGTETARIEKQE